MRAHSYCKRSVSLGQKPSTILGTRAVLAIRPKLRRFPEDPNMWGIILENSGGQADTVVVQIRIPPIAQIGIWSCSIQTNIIGERHKENRRDYKVSFTLLDTKCQYHIVGDHC